MKTNRNGKILITALATLVVVDWFRDWDWAKKLRAVFTRTGESGNDA